VPDDFTYVKTRLRVLNICCGKEKELLENQLKSLDGVKKIEVNTIGKIAFVTHMPSLISADKLVTELNKIYLGASLADSSEEEKHKHD